MIAELDCVALTRALPEFGLDTGDVGAVVMVFAGGAACEVEFGAEDGRTIALETLDATWIGRPPPRICRDRAVGSSTEQRSDGTLGLSAPLRAKAMPHTAGSLGGSFKFAAWGAGERRRP